MLRSSRLAIARGQRLAEDAAATAARTAYASPAQTRPARLQCTTAATHTRARSFASSSSSSSSSSSKSGSNSNSCSSARCSSRSATGMLLARTAPPAHPASSRALSRHAAYSTDSASSADKAATDAAKPADKDDKSAAPAQKDADAHAAALKEKDAKIKELNDALLYARADMQNLMRRTAEEKANASDYAITKLARDLTSSLDILQIALRSVPESLRKGAAGDAGSASAGDDTDPRRALVDLYSGLELTERSLLDMLKSHGVTEFDPTGEKFDPAFHEALYQAPVPGKTPGTVLETQKRGYKIKNRVLRAAQVGVVQSTD